LHEIHIHIVYNMMDHSPSITTTTCSSKSIRFYQLNI